MQLRIQAIKVPLRTDVIALVERRLRRAFERHRYSVRAVDVRITDINGPRGGLDKRAVIQVELHDGSDVRATQIAVDATEAVDLAVERARRALVRHVERRRTVARKRSRMPLVAAS